MMHHVRLWLLVSAYFLGDLGVASAQNLPRDATSEEGAVVEEHRGIARESGPSDPAPSAEETRTTLATPGAPNAPRYRVLPGAFYTPETSLGFALMGSASFWGDDDWMPAKQYSFVRLGGFYTLRRQLAGEFAMRLRRPGWVAELQVEFTTRVFPERYFGHGDNTSDAYVLYTEVASRLVHALRFRVAPQVFLTVAIRNQWRTTRDWRDGSVRIDAASDVLAPLQSCGQFRQSPFTRCRYGEGWGSHALAIDVEWDRRDHPGAAHRGTYVRLRLAPTFGEVVRPTRAWLEATVEGRAYLGLGRSHQHVVAARVDGRFNSAHVPFNAMATLGGSDRIRGMYTGRRRDRHALFGEVEYRTPFLWRLAGTVFAGVGTTFGYGSPLRGVAGNAGVGLRLRLDEASRMHARVDVSVGDYGWGIVGALGEAF